MQWIENKNVFTVGRWVIQHPIILPLSFSFLLFYLYLRFHNFSPDIFLHCIRPGRQYQVNLWRDFLCSTSLFSSTTRAAKRLTTGAFQAKDHETSLQDSFQANVTNYCISSPWYTILTTSYPLWPYIISSQPIQVLPASWYNTVPCHPVTYTISSSCY